MNVLIVDDEPLELDQLEFLIHPLFPYWNIYKAHDGSQALSLAQKVKIHLAFLDINLPGKSGLELGSDLKKNNNSMDLIIVTAYQDFMYAKQSIRLGVVEYITKPIIESELNDLLKKYSENHYLSDFSQLITDSLQIIHEQFAERLNLADLAEMVHVNPTYLSRRFHEEVGVSFSEYLTNHRIEMAKKYLTYNQGWSISTISEKTGFNSQHYFSTIFKKMIGITPKEFREKGK